MQLASFALNGTPRIIYMQSNAKQSHKMHSSDDYYTKTTPAAATTWRAIQPNRRRCASCCTKRQIYIHNDPRLCCGIHDRTAPARCSLFTRMYSYTYAHALHRKLHDDEHENTDASRGECRAILRNISRKISVWWKVDQKPATVCIQLTPWMRKKEA